MFWSCKDTEGGAGGGGERAEGRGKGGGEGGGGDGTGGGRLLELARLKTLSFLSTIETDRRNTW